MQEGVIQYRLDFTQQTLPDGLLPDELNVCRSRLFSMGLIGQDISRYAGLGYGNVSLRVPALITQDAFLITGSQTGHLPALEAKDYALVTACDPARNYLQAMGVIKPSSEAMTHAVIYQTLLPVQAVIHVHWPDLWQNALKQGMLVTAEEIPYGTPQMAAAVRQCLLQHNQYAGVLAMLGHEDGIVSWGRTLAEAESQLKQYSWTEPV